MSTERYFMARGPGGFAMLVQVGDHVITGARPDLDLGTLPWHEVDADTLGLEYAELVLRQLARRHPEHPSLIPYLPEDERPPGAVVARLHIDAPDVGRDGLNLGGDRG